MPIAFKEWCVTVRALAEGEQLITLCQNDGYGPDSYISFEHNRFFLFPTFDHPRNDLVRESHECELGRAIEEGVWADYEPTVDEFKVGAVSQPERVRLRAWADIAATWPVTDHRIIEALTPYTVWTPEYAEQRMGWRRRSTLHVVLLRAHRIPRPVTVKVRDDFHTPSRWVDVTRDLPFEGTAVLSDEEFDRALNEISTICESTATLVNS